jgi:SAM-dependent methyltransferase
VTALGSGAIEPVCPRCGGELASAGATVSCGGCGRDYPVREGVPSLLPDSVGAGDLRTAEAFAWHGREFTELLPEHEEHFLDVIAPRGPDFFRDKVVMDAGCGPGRHALFAARYGAREVWALDLGEAVETAHRLAAEEPRVHVLQADLLEPPFPPGGEERGFDFIFSLGVVHHLDDPAAAVRSLSRLLRPGGELFVWVYAREGNALARYAIEPIRRLTTRLPPRTLSLLTLPIAVTLYGLAKLVYGPAHGTPLERWLPARGWFGPLAGFSFRRSRAVVADQLVAPKTDYVQKSELRGWLEDAGLEQIAIASRNGNSWRARGARPAA